MSEQTTLESLLEMGFERNRAWVNAWLFPLKQKIGFRSEGDWINKLLIHIFREKAVAYTGNQGIEQAMDWWVWGAHLNEALPWRIWAVYVLNQNTWDVLFLG